MTLGIFLVVDHGLGPEISKTPITLRNCPKKAEIRALELVDTYFCVGAIVSEINPDGSRGETVISVDKWEPLPV